jgi:flagellar basal body L-ring protein FlgH
MKQGYCLLLLSLGLVAACSKKEEAASAPAPAEPAPTAAAAEAAPAAEPKRNWDAVVAEVARIRAMRPLPDDKRARMLQLQDELMAASNSDPAAREAWANLSRIINNR